MREWLDAVFATGQAGTHLAKVDYDIYAAGEAAYGWLNANFNIGGEGDLDQAAKALLDKLSAAFDSRNASVGHVKFMLQGTDGQWMGNLTGKAETGSIRKTGRGAAASTLLVNARVELRPEELQKIVLDAVQEGFAGFNVAQTSLSCLIPGRPNPTYRYDKVV